MIPKYILKLYSQWHLIFTTVARAGNRRCGNQSGAISTWDSHDSKISEILEKAIGNSATDQSHKNVTLGICVADI